MTPADIHAHFDLQFQASRAHVDVPLLVRRERLLRLRKMLDENGSVLAAAVQADFGMRSPRLTEVADFFVAVVAFDDRRGDGPAGSTSRRNRPV